MHIVLSWTPNKANHPTNSGPFMTFIWRWTTTSCDGIIPSSGRSSPAGTRHERASTAGEGAFRLLFGLVCIHIRCWGNKPNHPVFSLWTPFSSMGGMAPYFRMATGCCLLWPTLLALFAQPPTRGVVKQHAETPNARFCNGCLATLLARGYTPFHRHLIDPSDGSAPHTLPTPASDCAGDVGCAAAVTTTVVSP